MGLIGTYRLPLCPLALPTADQKPTQSASAWVVLYGAEWLLEHQHIASMSECAGSAFRWVQLEAPWVDASLGKYLPMVALDRGCRVLVVCTSSVAALVLGPAALNWLLHRWGCLFCSSLMPWDRVAGHGYGAGRR